MSRLLLVTCALGCFVLACRFSQDAASTSAPATETSSQVEIATPEILSPGNYTLSLANGDDQRDVVLHIPTAYDGSTAMPLVIVLHGGAGNGDQIQRLSEMDENADEFGFVVAYPDGSGRLGDKILTWNSGYCCGYSFENNVDDVGFISLLIDNLISHYAIDPQRVYITGISNGGMMAYRAGAELADKVAAIAPIAGSIGGQQNENASVYTIPQPSSSVAVMAFHGMEDEHVLYDGGIGPAEITFGRIDFSVTQAINFWVQANGCDMQSKPELRANSNIIVDTFFGCADDATVVLVTIVDGGHAWPGAQRGLVSDKPTQDISANEMMLQFFLEHPKQ